MEPALPVPEPPEPFDDETASLLDAFPADALAFEPLELFVLDFERPPEVFALAACA